MVLEALQIIVDMVMTYVTLACICMEIVPHQKVLVLVISLSKFHRTGKRTTPPLKLIGREPTLMSILRGYQCRLVINNNK